MMFIKGFTYGYDVRRGDYRSAEAELSMRRLSALGGDWAALAFTVRQDTFHSTVIRPDYRWTVTDADVVCAVKKLHGMGLKVCMKPMVNCGDGVWRANIRFPEPVGDQTGWYACKAASDKELKNAQLVFRWDNGKETIQADVSSAAVRDKKILTFAYASGTATGLPVLMTDGGGNKMVIGLGVSYNPDNGTGFIRRITSRVYNDMTSDGLFKGSAAASEPSVTSLINTGRFCPSCGTPRSTDGTSGAEQQTPQAAVNQNLEQIPGETERVKIRLSGVEASVYIKNADNPTRWLPGNAADGNETTCWQYNGGKGAWLSLNTRGAEAVDEIWFKNGFWGYNDKGKDQYSINARPKEIKVQFCYEGENNFRDDQKITLKDEWGSDWQRFTLGHHEGVASVRITVNSIYKGSYYKNDVCLSEVMLVQYASAANAMPAQEQQAAVVYDSRPEVTGCELLDRLSTRSGPGTQYQEPGTFFRNDTWKGKTVRVLKKATGNGVWWVQVDFQTDNGNSYRVWTGKKRVDVKTW